MEGTILIADDEAYVRLLIEQSMEELVDNGVQILTAGDGKAALETIERERPDLVFLDLMMPELNGFEVCRTVKNERGIDSVFIVLLTAKGQELDKQKGREAGADVYMTKPFNPDTLLQLATQVLEARTAGRIAPG